MDGSFLDLSTSLVLANYTIRGAIAGVLFCGTVGCWLQVAFIQLNALLISFSFLFFWPSSFFTISLEHCVQLETHCRIIVCVLLRVLHNAT